MREVHQNSNRTYINCSGPEYFGLSNPNVIMMIQNLPNADKCIGYMWRDIENEDGYGVVVDAPPRKKAKSDADTGASSPNSPAYTRSKVKIESTPQDVSSPDDTSSMFSTEDTVQVPAKRRRRWSMHHFYNPLIAWNFPPILSIEGLITHFTTISYNNAYCLICFWTTLYTIVLHGVTIYWFVCWVHRNLQRWQPMTGEDVKIKFRFLSFKRNRHNLHLNFLFCDQY